MAFYFLLCVQYFWITGDGTLFPKLHTYVDRSLQHSNFHSQREVLLPLYGVGNFSLQSHALTNRFIGGASCMCIAASVAELVSAYPTSGGMYFTVKVPLLNNSF